MVHKPWYTTYDISAYIPWVLTRNQLHKEKAYFIKSFFLTLQIECKALLEGEAS